MNTLKILFGSRKPVLNKYAFMRSIFLLTVVFFYGYKKSAIAFWIMFPVFFLFTQMQDNREFFYSVFFMPLWIFGTPIFYLMYGLLLKWMNRTAKKYYA